LIRCFSQKKVRDYRATYCVVLHGRERLDRLLSKTFRLSAFLFLSAVRFSFQLQHSTNSHLAENSLKPTFLSLWLKMNSLASLRQFSSRVILPPIKYGKASPRFLCVREVSVRPIRLSIAFSDSTSIQKSLTSALCFCRRRLWISVPPPRASSTTPR